MQGQDYTQKEAEKLLGKMCLIENFVSRPSVAGTENAKKVMEDLARDKPLVTHFNWGNADKEELAALKVIDGKYKELAAQLANIQTVDLGELDRKYQAQRSTLVGKLEDKWKEIIDTKDLELFQKNLQAYPGNIYSDFPTMFQYIVLNPSIPETLKLKMIEGMRQDAATRKYHQVEKIFADALHGVNR